MSMFSIEAKTRWRINMIAGVFAGTVDAVIVTLLLCINSFVDVFLPSATLLWVNDFLTADNFLEAVLLPVSAGLLGVINYSILNQYYDIDDEKMVSTILLAVIGPLASIGMTLCVSELAGMFLGISLLIFSSGSLFFITMLYMQEQEDLKMDPLEAFKQEHPRFCASVPKK